MSEQDNAVNTEVVTQDSTVAAPAAPEPKETEVAEDNVLEQSLEELSGDESVDEAETEEVSSEVTPEEKSDETKTDEQPQGEKPLAPKSENRFQKLANENRELKEQMARLTSQETQVAAEQELLGQVNPETGEYFTPQEAERIARAHSLDTQQQALSQDRYELEVKQNQITLADEANQALREYPIFDPHSDQYNAALAERVDQLLGQNLIFEEGTNRVIGSHTSPLNLYKTIFEATQMSMAEGQIKGQKATQKMLASVDTTGNASQATKTKDDPMLEAFRQEAGM